MRPGAMIAACLVTAGAMTAGAAHAQQPVMVFGGGYARDCYEAVKGKLALAKALSVCDIALEQENLSPSNRAATYINRGILQMRATRYDRAEADYASGLALSPDMPEAKINQGAMLYYMDRFREAVAALNEGVKVKDTEARAAAHYNRGLALERLGDIQNAYADYKTALMLDPKLAQAERQLKRFTVVSAGG